MKPSQTGEILKSTIFCDVTSCDPAQVGQHFGGTTCLHLHNRRVSQARNQQEASRGFDTVHSYETLVNLLDYRMSHPRRFTLHSHCCKNLKSNTA
jgi:hypothetical protein